MTHYVRSARWLSKLVFLSTAILCVGCLPAVLTDPVPTRFLPALYFSLVYITQNFLVSALFGLLMLPVFILVKSDWWRTIFTLLPLTAFLLFFLASSKVFAFWRFYVNSVIFHLFMAKGGRTYVFQISREMYVSIILVVLFGFAFSALLIAVAKKLSKKFSVKPFWITLGALYILVQSVTLSLVNRQNISYLQYLPKSPYFIALSWANILENVGFNVFPKDSLGEQLRQVLGRHDKIQYPIHPLNYQLPKKPLNVLFIVLDSLRYDMVNPVDMPNVYDFSRQSDQFINHISGGDCTRAGIFSLFYGVPSTYWDSVITHHQGAITVRAFQDNNYQLEFLGSAGLLSPPFYRTVFASVKNLQLLTPGNTPWERDQKITEQMTDFLNQQKDKQRPFFGFVFYDAPHAYNALAFTHPFAPVAPMNYFTVNNHTKALPIFHMYQNAVFAADRLVGRLLNTLKADGLMDNTVVVITSDHGQEFNEYHNNYWEHPSGFSKYQLRTPLLISWPGHTPAVYPYRTTHFDIAPTILKGVLGVDNPASDYSVGHDLYQSHDEDAEVIGRYGQYALVTDDLVMPFHKSGLYRFTNKRMGPLQVSKLDQSDRQAMFKTLWWFY